MPPWVKVFLIVGLVLLLIFVISLVLGVKHGPGMHSGHRPLVTAVPTAAQPLSADTTGPHQS
jgi:hypothetical protein